MLPVFLSPRRAAAALLAVAALVVAPPPLAAAPALPPSPVVTGARDANGTVAPAQTRPRRRTAAAE